MMPSRWKVASLVLISTLLGVGANSVVIIPSGDCGEWGPSSQIAGTPADPEGLGAYVEGTGLTVQFHRDFLSALTKNQGISDLEQRFERFDNFLTHLRNISATYFLDHREETLRALMAREDHFARPMDDGAVIEVAVVPSSVCAACYGCLQNCLAQCSEGKPRRHESCRKEAKAQADKCDRDLAREERLLAQAEKRWYDCCDKDWTDHPLIKEACKQYWAEISGPIDAAIDVKWSACRFAAAFGETMCHLLVDIDDCGCGKNQCRGACEACM